MLDVQDVARGVSGVYMIENTQNGYRYIGQSVDVKGRWTEHLSCLRRGVHRSNSLNFDFLVFGEDCFRFELLEEVPKSMLADKERYYISIYTPEYNPSEHPPIENRLFLYNMDRLSEALFEELKSTVDEEKLNVYYVSDLKSVSEEELNFICRGSNYYIPFLSTELILRRFYNILTVFNLTQWDKCKGNLDVIIH